MIGKRVTFTASLPIKYTKRKKWILASCPILDMHSQGETEKKAKKNLEEALSLFFVSCFERGALDAVLKQCGFKALYPPLQPERKGSLVTKENYITVPIPFLVDPTPETECHA